MHIQHRKLKRNLRSRIANTFDSEFALELGTTTDLAKDKNNTDSNNSIEMSMLNGSGVHS